MMYVRYNKDTGKITSFGDMDEIFINEEIRKGNPIIRVSKYVNGENWSVNLNTKELQNVTPLESS